MAEQKVTQSVLVPDKELFLIKATFSENEYLLRTMRNLFLGLEMTQEEKDLIQSTFKNEELRKLMHKRYFPEVGKDIPVAQTIDLWTGIDLVGKHPEEIRQTLSVRKNMIDMTRKALALLENPDGEKVNVSYDYNPFSAISSDELGITLTSRNRFIGHIEFQTRMLEVIAGQKSETLEQTKKRLDADSAR